MESLATPPTTHAIASRATSLVYILAASHSGSTLLAMLLGSQPEVCTVGEMRVPSLGDPNAYLCSCGETIKRCAFWAEVSTGMAKRGFAGFDVTNARLSIHDVDNAYIRRLLVPLPRGRVLEAIREAALSLSPAWPRHLCGIQHRNTALVDVLRETTGAKIVVDSSKVALHLKYLLRSPGLRIKIIRLLRDGRASTCSSLGHGFKRGTPKDTMAVLADSWRRNIEAGDRILAGLPTSQWLCLKYEELCQKPTEVLRNICDFIGIDSSQPILDFRSKRQHILGNDMRLKSGSEIRLDERWRKGLSSELVDVFENVAGAMNRKLGYT